MLTLKELNPHSFPTDAEIDTNLATLLERMNKVRTAWAKPMIVTSGLRSKADQIAVYKAKGITDIKKIPMGSQHLHGAACDISDPKGDLAKWVQGNMPLMEQIGLWFEDFKSTPNWVHFQIFPPKSGNRIFKP